MCFIFHLYIWKENKYNKFVWDVQFIADTNLTTKDAMLTQKSKLVSNWKTNVKSEEKSMKVYYKFNPIENFICYWIEAAYIDNTIQNIMEYTDEVL